MIIGLEKEFVDQDLLIIRTVMIGVIREVTVQGGVIEGKGIYIGIVLDLGLEEDLGIGIIYLEIGKGIDLVKDKEIDLCQEIEVIGRGLGIDHIGLDLGIDDHVLGLGGDGLEVMIEYKEGIAVQVGVRDRVADEFPFLPLKGCVFFCLV